AQIAAIAASPPAQPAPVLPTAERAPVTGLVVGGVAGGLAVSSKSGTNGHCTPDLGRCDDAGIDAMGRAHTFATISTIGFAAGGAALAGALVLYLTSPRSDVPQVTVGLGRSSVALSARFW